MTRIPIRSFKLLLTGLYAADKIFTQTTPLERDTLQKLARQKAGGIGVEIGSAFGASACFIAQGIRPGGGKLYCVDRWNIEYRQNGDTIDNYLYREDGTLAKFGWREQLDQVVYEEVGVWSQPCPTYTQFIENTARFADVIHPLRAESLAAAREFAERIDFLFIDGWHEYGQVAADWDAWKAKLNPGATVVFHDWAWADGVKRIVNERVMAETVNHRSTPNMFWASLK